MSGRRRQAGQALVETALALPLLAILIFGVMGLARLANASEVLHNVCREGARWSAMTQEGTSNLPAPADVVNRVVSLASGEGVLLTASMVTVDQGVEQNLNGLPTTFSRVEIRYGFSFAVPILSSLMPSITLDPVAEMRNENN